MICCRSCGRNITSGTIRCTKCGTPYHLSCSHRYQISAEGIFDVCCQSNVSAPYNKTFHMRTRNKRRLQENANNVNNCKDDSVALINEQNSDTIHGKVVKIEKDMGVCDKLITDSDSNDCCQIIHEVYRGNDNDTSNECNNDNPVEILLDSVNNKLENESELININNEANNKITLETVWQGISSLQSSISNISNSLETVSVKLNTFDPRIKDLETNFSTIKTKTTNFDNVQNDVRGLKEEIERLTNELEQVRNSPKEKAVDFSEIFSEMRERETKSKNLIIYNVAEDNLRISQDYSTLEDINKFNALMTARDNSRAREILENIPNIDLDDLQTKRIGRVNSNACRPLRVILQSREEVMLVIRNKGLISQQYNVKTDLTKLQQKKIKDLREELHKANLDSDNPQMTIKFINGEPKIIPIRRNFMKHE